MRPVFVPLFVVGLLLVALVPTMPYGYYQVMRWLIVAASLWLAMNCHGKGREGWVWVWGVIAGIYNPIFPVRASREVWTFVNLATVAVVVIYSVKTITTNRGK